MEKYPLYTHFTVICRKQTDDFCRRMQMMPADTYAESTVVEDWIGTLNYLRGAADMLRPYLVSTHKIDETITAEKKQMEDAIEEMCVLCQLSEKERVSLYSRVGLDL